MSEDKIALTRKRAELIELLAKPTLPPIQRVRVQGELSVLNAQIKALNTTNAAQLKAAADRRRAAGMTEFQAHSARARANAGLPSNGSDVPHLEGADADPDDDPGQTAAIDSWIDAVLLRHDIDFARDAKGRLMVTNDPSVRAPMEPNLAAAIEMLVSGIYAACRGQELPDLPRAVKPAKPAKAAPSKSTPAPKPKKR